MKHLVFLLVLCLWQTYTVGQDFVARKITQKDGLPSNTVYQLLQDKAGFLWVATENGIARYNGHAFEEFYNPALRSTTVSGLLEDAAGTLWMHNFFGEIMYLKDNALHKLDSWESRYNTGFPNLSARGQGLIINSPVDLFEYTPATKEWKNLSEELRKIHGDSILAFTYHFQDTKKQTWVAYNTQANFYIRQIPLNNEAIFKTPVSKGELTSNVLRITSWNQRLLVFDSKTKALFYVDEGKRLEFDVPVAEFIAGIRRIHAVNDTLLAFTGPNEARIYNSQSKKFLVFNGINASDVLLDREGGLWISSLNNGLHYINDLEGKLFPNSKYGLHTRMVKDFSHNRILAGGYDGSITEFTPQKTRTVLLPSHGAEVQSMLIDDAANQLLVASDKIYWLDLDNFRILKSLTIVSTKNMIRYGSKYYLATSSGAVELDSWGNIHYLIPHLRFSAVAREPGSERIWFGSQKGVFIYNLQTNTYKTWIPENHQGSPGISAICSMTNGIAIGTQTNGVFLVQQNRTTHITRENQLASNRIKKIYVSGDTIFAGTDKGISLINREGKVIQNISETNGLESREVYDLAVMGPQLWVSHPGGVQILSGNRKRNTQKPQLHLETIEATRKLLHPDSVNLSPEMGRRLTIGLNVSNNLRARGGTRIQYRIRELSSQWNVTTLESPVADFAYLPYGTLHFEALAVNEDGIESPLKTLEIRVVPPFWRRSWFLILMMAGSFSLLLLLIQARITRVNNRNKSRLQEQNREQELIIAQLTSIRAQMNPHFIFNTMSSIQGKVMNGMKEDATLLIQKYSALMRKVLDLSDEETILIDDEIAVLENYLTLEQDRFSGDFRYHISVAPEIKEDYLRIPTLITQPFVENALRHGLMHKQGEKILNISFDLQNNYMIIRIDDNGIGREASGQINLNRRRQYSSFALGAYRKRIELLNKNRDKKIQLEIIDKKDQFNLSSGTLVIIRIPLDNQNSKEHG